MEREDYVLIILLFVFLVFALLVYFKDIYPIKPTALVISPIVVNESSCYIHLTNDSNGDLNATRYCSTYVNMTN